MAGKKDATELPPSVSSEELERMILEAFARNTANWLSEEMDFAGAGPQPLDDSAFGGD